MWFNYYQNQSVYLHAETHLTAYIKPPSSLFHQAFTVTRDIMSNNVLSFSVGYNPINKSNTFTSGDCITGQISLELAKDCKIDSLCVKLKGKAEVRLTQQYNIITITKRSTSVSSNSSLRRGRVSELLLSFSCETTICNQTSFIESIFHECRTL